MPLPKGKQEVFAQHLAANGNASAAWLAATGGNPAYSDANGSKWAGKTAVMARVVWLRSAAESHLRQKGEAESRAVFLSIAEKREKLARIARACPSEAGPDNPDSIAIMTKAGPFFTFPDKIQAMKLDNDLAGDGSDAGAADALTELLARLQ